MQVLGHEVDGTYMLYEYNNCSGFSGSPGFNKQLALTFARTSSRRWSCALWATASGWDSGREGGRRRLQGDSYQRESGHSYQSVLTYVRVLLWAIHSRNLLKIHLIEPVQHTCSHVFWSATQANTVTHAALILLKFASLEGHWCKGVKIWIKYISEGCMATHFHQVE